MGRKVLIGVDDSPHSRVMVDCAFQQALHHTADEIYLANVLSPSSATAASAAGPYPMAPLASAATVAAIHQGQEAQRRAEVEKAKDVLRQVTELIAIDYKVPRDNIHSLVLPSEGGASGVSGALLKQAKDLSVDILVVGNRGMGAIKRSLMSLVGLGSVSDAVLAAATCPVLVVRWDPAHLPAQSAEARPPPMAPVPKRVCVGVDDSPTSGTALLWALDNILQPHDQLHIASAALSVPYPVLDEPAAVAAVQAQSAEEQRVAALQVATRLVDAAADTAVSHGVTRTKIVPAVLTPNGGSSEAGSALAQYANDKAIDVMVVGSRGLGAMQRHLMGFVGLGSVSQYLAHHVHCALAVVRDPPAGVGPNADLARASENVTFHVIPETDENEMA